jgi:hypothetical protein
MPGYFRARPVDYGNHRPRGAPRRVYERLGRARRVTVSGARLSAGEASRLGAMKGARGVGAFEGRQHVAPQAV